MGLFLKKRVEMPDKMIFGNTEFVFDRKLGFHVGEWIVWDRKTKILLEFQSTEGNIGDIVLEKVNWVNDHKWDRNWLLHRFGCRTRLFYGTFSLYGGRLPV